MTGPSLRKIRVVFGVLAASIVAAAGAVVTGYLSGGWGGSAAALLGLVSGAGGVWALSQR
jgi:hypothetical protein